MPHRRSEDFLRVHRGLLEAERAYTHLLGEFARGRVTREDLAAQRAVLHAIRELAEAVAARVLEEDPPPATGAMHPSPAPSGPMHGASA